MNVSYIINEIGDAFIALGGREDLEGTISTKRIQDILKGEFELSDDMEVRESNLLTNNF